MFGAGTSFDLSVVAGTSGVTIFVGSGTFSSFSKTETSTMINSDSFFDNPSNAASNSSDLLTTDPETP